MRREFELSEEQRDRIMAANQPVPAMYLSGGALMGNSPQENANIAWRAVGKEAGFIWDTARPVAGKSDRFITADPIEEGASA